jgi:serine phosphatase RsbU (regulator of sigma subunit)
MPIAIHENMSDFTNHNISLFENDCVYLMTDGYEDQFGGKNKKKFMSKQLKDLLIENCKKTMNEQKTVLEKSLIEWIDDGEQIDDITILGIKI